MFPTKQTKNSDDHEDGAAKNKAGPKSPKGNLKKKPKTAKQAKDDNIKYQRLHRAVNQYGMLSCRYLF